MTIYGFLSFFAFFLYLQLGLYVFLYKTNQKLNRQFFYLCLSLVVWSFGLIFVHFSPSIQIVQFWLRVSSFGWTFFPALMISFFLAFRRDVNHLLANLIRLFFFFFGLVLFLRSLTGNLLANSYNYYDGRWHFRPNMDSEWYWFFVLYLLLSLAASLYLVITWGIKAKTIKEKKQAKIIITTLILFFSGILLSNYILPIVRVSDAPGLMHIFSFVWVTGFGYAIVRYKFLVLNPETAANEIIAKMKELLFFLDTDGNILKINDFTAETLGFETQEIVNKPFESLIVEKHLAKDKVAKLTDKEAHKSQEFYIKQKNGEVIPFNLSRAEVKDDAGDLLGTIVVGYDVRYEILLEEEISLRKKTEQALRKSELMYRELYSMVRMMCDNVPDMIWAKDLNRRYVFANKATCDKLLNAADSEEPIGKTDLFFFTREKETHPKNKMWFTYGDICIDSDNITLRNREASRFVEFGNIKGKFVYLDVHKAPFWDEHGELIGIVGCGRDVTQEKRMEEEHREAEKALSAEKELLSVTLKSIGDAVISTDTSGRIILMNNVAEQLTGWKKEEVWGESIEKVFNVINSKTKERIVSPIKKVLQSGQIIALEPHSVLITKNGDQISIADSGAPIKNRDGETIGVVLVFSDVTEKERMEQELLKVQKLETVGILAGGIAHDFNNILTAITGNISLSIMQMQDSPEIAKRLKEAEKATFRARDLTQQLLTFAKGGKPVKKVTRLDKILRETAQFATSGSNVSCYFNIAGNLYQVEIDESQICQVINNLVINAKQAMPEGGAIVINAENIDLPSGVLPLDAGKYVRIIVKDSGCGIPKSYLEKIFDPFFTTKQTGSGLGLTSSFNIIQKHNGHLTVDSQEENGSQFTIYLPASDKAVKVFEDKDFFVDYHSSGDVLLMDDESDIRDTLGVMLESLGYTVIYTKDGAEALERFREAYQLGQSFEFVVLDLTIPGGLGGKDTIVKLREIEPEIKAIVSSGYSTDPVLANYKLYGFNTVMEKPYTIKNLVDAIKAL